MARTRVMLSATAALLAAPVAMAQTHSPSTHGLSQADRHYLQQDARGAAYELQLSQLATQRAQNPQVRQYANMVVSDHAQANQALQDVAQQNGLTLPNEPNHRQRQQLASLQKLNGSAFDKAYIQYVKQANQRDVQDEQRIAAATQNPQIKDYVQREADLDRKHVQMASTLGAGQPLSATPGGTATNGASQQTLPNGQGEPNRTH